MYCNGWLFCDFNRNTGLYGQQGFHLDSLLLIALKPPLSSWMNHLTRRLPQTTPKNFIFWVIISIQVEYEGFGRAHNKIYWIYRDCIAFP